MAAAMKHMASNFAKIDKFKRVDFRRWQKKMHFLLSSMSVVSLILNGMSDSLFDIYQNVKTSKELWDTLEAKYMVKDASSKKFLVSNFTNYKMTDSRPVLEQYNELLGILGRFTQHKMNMDESIQVSCIIDKLPPSWKDFKHTLKHLKEELTLVELGSHLRIEESLRAQDNDKPKGNNVAGPSVVNMVEHNNSSRYNDNKGKRKHHDTKADPNKKPKVTCWKCGKPGHLKKDCKAGNVGNKANGSGTKGSVDGSSNSLKGATMHVCKDRCWFKTYESLNDGSILHMGNKSTALVHGRGCVDLGLVLEKSFLWLSQGFWVEAMLTACYLLNKVPNKRKRITPYELWTKKKPNLNYLRVWSCRAVLRLPDPKLKTLGERSIECIFVRYAEHSKVFRFYVIEPNDSGAINSIIESRDAIFDENKFSSVLRPSQRSLVKGTEDSGGSVVPEKVTKEDDPKTFDKAMKYKDVAFWKEAINDEMDSIMGNNTWVLAKLPPGCRPLGCKWIFKRKLKVDGSIEKFKARLVIQGFKQKSGIDYFDTYALVAPFLNGELDEEVDLTKEFLLSRFSMKDIREADVILDIRIKHESNGIAISQSYYIEKVLKKFNYFDCTPVSTPMDTNDAERYTHTYEAYEQFLAMTNQEAEGSGSGIKRTRTYIPRDREEAEQRLLEDYFGNDDTPPKYPKENFRRKYRMSSTLFAKIVNDITSYDAQPLPKYFHFFRQRIDAPGHISIGPILKIISAIRQLAYGISPDAFDEYLQISERCLRECLDNFTKCIYILYVEEYLRKPSSEDIEKTYALHEEKHGLPGMLESIDCMHWNWKNCPKALHGQFKRKHHKYPILMLEAVADQ
ncbi:zinc finger, CCHC-type containing protein [Tanacetum coccineum]